MEINLLFNTRNKILFEKTLNFSSDRTLICSTWVYALCAQATSHLRCVARISPLREPTVPVRDAIINSSQRLPSI